MSAVIVEEGMRKREAALVAQLPNANATPMQMIALAVSQGADIEKMKQLMDLRDRFEANEARKAFMEALANFKKNPPKVVKDLENKQYKSRYSSLANLVNTVNAALGAHGLNARWSIEQSEKSIAVTCILSHTLGHSESVTMTGGPDTSGAKNPLQQWKSTLTYLEGATFQAITGIVASDEGDDDGNGASNAATVSDEQIANLQALIEEVSADRAKLLAYLKVESLGQIRADAYTNVIRMLEAKRK